MRSDYQFNWELMAGWARTSSMAARESRASRSSTAKNAEYLPAGSRPSSLIDIAVESYQPLAHASTQLLAVQQSGGAKQIARGGNRYAASDDPFDEVAPGDSSRQVSVYFGICVVCHVGYLLSRAAAVCALREETHLNSTF